LTGHPASSPPPDDTDATRQGSEPPSSRPVRDSIIDEVDRDESFSSEKLRNLSARLALGAEADVTDEDITSVLGAESLKAFRYAQESLHGRVRKVTGEPAFCHSADVALRALDLGYPDRLLQVCLLHDAAEDSSDDIVTLFFQLEEIKRLFEADIALDVRMLTNRYQIILQSLSGLLPDNLPFEPESMGAVFQALDDLREQVPRPVRDEFDHEFYQLHAYFLPSISRWLIIALLAANVLARREVIRGRRYHISSWHPQPVPNHGKHPLGGHALAQLPVNVSRGIVAPLHLAGRRIEGIDICPVVVDDACRCVRDSVLHQDARVHRPGRAQRPVHHDTSFNGSGSKSPQQAACGGFQRVDVTVT